MVIDCEMMFAPERGGNAAFVSGGPPEKHGQSASGAPALLAHGACRRGRPANDHQVSASRRGSAPLRLFCFTMAP